MVARYDAVDTAAHETFAAETCGQAECLDLVIAATGVLIPQEQVERDVPVAATMIETNFTGHVTALLAFGEAMRRRGSGAIVVTCRRSRPSGRAKVPTRFTARRKGYLDAFARGYADSLHGTGVRLLLVRPGFVTGRMTQGMKPAPLATTPEAVGAATACAGGRQVRRVGAGSRWSASRRCEADPAAGLAQAEELASATWR